MSSFLGCEKDNVRPNGGCTRETIMTPPTTTTTTGTDTGTDGAN